MTQGLETEPRQPATARREPAPLRADVQALRALAVTLVVVGHAWPHLLPGGFVGVDVFFVISGYLVAGSLLGTAARGERVRIGDFLARRARRILPAASVIAIVTTVAFCFVLDPLEHVRYVGDALAALLFVANFRSNEDAAGYFSLVDPSPFRHYWSLGVEEQFYLVLPVLALLLVLMRIRGRAVLVLLAAATVVSYIGGAWLATTDPGMAFYMLPSRAWEFGVGALAALVPSLSDRLNRRTTLAAALAGVAAIAASVVVLSESSQVPGPLLLPAILGTALLLNARAAVSPSSRWWAPATWVGDRSYAIYLTHWPPITWLIIREQGAQASLPSSVAAVAGAVLAAMALHAFVERPLHRGARGLPLGGVGRTGVSVALAAAGVAVVALVPSWVALQSTRVSTTPTAEDVLSSPLLNPGFVSADVRPAVGLARTLNGLYEGCHGTQEVVAAAPCEYGPGDVPEIVIVGDSHAANWYDAARTAFADRRIAFLTHTDCPLYDLDPAIETGCDQWRESVLTLLAERPPPVVVLANYSAAYVHDGLPGAEERFAAGWQATLDRLDVVPAVVVLGDVPISPFDPPRCLARHVDDARECDFQPADATVVWNKLEQRVVTATGTPWVDTASWFCADNCAALGGNVQIWRDAAGHLTPESSRLVAPRLRQALVESVPGFS